MPALVVRAAIGCLAALAVALAAWRAGALSVSGALAATVVGTAAVMGGWGWGALLVLYFVTSSVLSRVGAAEKQRRTGAIVAKGGGRDAVQVIANGGVFALLVVWLAVGWSAGTVIAGAAAGALAAAAADTWATEVGVLFGGPPRTLPGLRVVPAGTSGAVTLAGTAAMIAGALTVALAARAFALVDAPVVITVAGCAGALADTLVGGTLQQRRWCDACTVATERRVHDCGAATRHAGGLAMLDNDAVNLLATVVGAAAALLLAFES